MAGGFPRTTHTWLQPLYNAFNSPTGKPAFYGTSGMPRVASGGIQALVATNFGASGFPATGVGASGLYTHLGRAAYGSTGTIFTMNDVVDALKNIGILPR